MPAPTDKSDVLGATVGRPSRGRRAFVFTELEAVRLSQNFLSDAGMIPKGTEATVLQVFDGGSAYQVEFEGPYEAPETVPAACLEANRARSA